MSGTIRCESSMGATAPAPQAAGRASDAREIRALIARYGAAANARDVPAVVRCYAPTDAVLLYDVGGPPLRGVAAVART
jgi:ketosteroid isomerase-like protein